MYNFKIDTHYLLQNSNIKLNLHLDDTQDNIFTFKFDISQLTQILNLVNTKLILPEHKCCVYC